MGVSRDRGKDDSMKEDLKVRIANTIDDKLKNEQIAELEGFFRQALSSNLGHDDENFFRNFAYEMTGELKELALLIIDFRKDLKAKINPEITDLAIKYIPQATDQLEGIIETTEMAANKIMDNLEIMQGQTEKMEKLFTSLKEGEVGLPGEKKVYIDSQTINTIYPLINYMESGIQNYMSLISDSLNQASDPL